MLLRLSRSSDTVLILRCSSVTSILLPVFFSYKALRTSDPAVLTPWLMYWTTLSLFIVVENQLHFILSWVPFYSWMRFGLHLYLVLPGQQGSVYIYRQYVHPFLEEHERQIDTMISEGHAKAKAAGMDAVKRAIEYVRVQILGQPPRPPTPPPSRNVSYADSLFNRFAMPAARDTFAAMSAGGSGAGDLFSMLGKALQSNTSTSAPPEVQARDLARSGTLVPNDLQGAARADFIAATRERLRTYMLAIDDAETTGPHQGSRDIPIVSTPRGESSHTIPRKPYPRGGNDDLSRSRSESEFEDLGYETMPDPEQYRTHGDGAARGTSKDSPGWSNFIWGNYGERDSAAEDARHGGPHYDKKER